MGNDLIEYQLLADKGGVQAQGEAEDPRCVWAALSGRRRDQQNTLI